jgi:hypothetical protein
MKISAVNKATGEIIKLDANTPEQIVSAWRIAQEYVKTAEVLRDQLKRLVPSLVTEKGTSEPIGNFQFRISNVQRMNYDKAIMRNIFDEDTFDLLLIPDKPTIDKYIKEHLDELGGNSTKLRENMIELGRPYQIIKLEKLGRD